jgi:hypothetical protein
LRLLFNCYAQRLSTRQSIQDPAKGEEKEEEEEFPSAESPRHLHFSFSIDIFILIENVSQMNFPTLYISDNGNSDKTFLLYVSGLTLFLVV